MQSLVVILVAVHLAGRLAARVGQPAVIGEMLAGIVLGPSIFGAVAPSIFRTLLPAEELPLLGELAQVGVVLFVFIVGLHVDYAALRRDARHALTVSLGGLGLSFVLGAALAFWLHPRYAPATIARGPFALFVGTAMSVTAFPVLARILADRRLLQTPIGALAVNCAAVTDAMLWMLLAVDIAVMRTMHPGAAAAISPWRWLDPIFLAFVVGLMVPRGSTIAARFSRWLQRPLAWVLLPLVFADAGLRTDLAPQGSRVDLVALGAIVLTATVGKVGGTLLAARAGGESLRDAARLGVLMNTRGLMELVVLDIGRSLGVLTPSLYAMLVVMAVATTVMTAPMLGVLERRSETTLQKSGGRT